jgi:hypothetical protein
MYKEVGVTGVGMDIRKWIFENHLLKLAQSILRRASHPKGMSTSIQWMSSKYIDITPFHELRDHLT